MAKLTTETTEKSAAGNAPSLSAIAPRTVFLGGLFFFALFTALYIASEVAIPVMFALVLKLVLMPVSRLFEKARMPRTLSALLILLFLLGLFLGFGTMLSGPLTSWAERLPTGVAKLQDHLGFLRTPIEKVHALMTKAENLTNAAATPVVAVAVQGNGLSDRIMTGTQAFVSGLFATLVILFFLLVSGDTFLRRLVEILPNFNDKRQAVEISQQVERDISHYLRTVTVMNALVGLATSLVAIMTGLGDPVLWGTLAFVLNYIPIIGPLICIGILVLAGLLNSVTGGALIPAGLYLIIHLLEGEMVTPMLLARRFTLNPVLVILSLAFWYWLWGIPGAMLAVPMLAITKIICDRIQTLMPVGHFIGG